LAEQKKTARKPAVRKPAASRKKKTAPTYEDVAMRAYFIHLEGSGAGDLENWLRAERELASA
jgi:hypothetical protein